MPANNVLSFPGVTGNSYDLYIGYSGQYWNGTTFAAITTAAWTNFAIVGTQQDTTGIFNWTVPFALPSGPSYDFIVRQRESTNAAPSDPIDGTSSYSWDGTNLGIVVPSGGSINTVAGNVNGNVSGNVVGSVGNVSGNVNGSVGSVAQAVILAENALDGILAEAAVGALPAVNIRQAITMVFNAAVFGILNNGNGSPSSLYNPAGTIERAQITQDNKGNRTAINFINLP